jgi:hypothetical protein
MSLPPNAHIILGLAFLAFTILLAVANYGRTKRQRRGTK